MADRAAVAEVEEWFLSRRIPHFIEGYSATRDVFTRALPALTLVLVLELIGVLDLSWPWWGNLLVDLDGPFLWVTICMFLLAGVVFVVARIPREVGELGRFESWAVVEGMVAAPPPTASTWQPVDRRGRRPGPVCRDVSGGTSGWWCCSARGCRSPS